MKETKVYTRIYLLKDSLGNTTSAVVEEGCDRAQICGMHDRDGKPVHFESDAYHIGKFCEDHGIECRIINREEDFDALWDGPDAKTKE
jgi:hypothetical protein